MKKHNQEINFEEFIEDYLTKNAGYRLGNAKDYDTKTALFGQDVIDFVKTTQPKFWERLQLHCGDDSQTQLINDLVQSLDKLGSLHTLRYGFKSVGKTVKIAYFAPNSTLNQTTAQDYTANILKITRQIITEHGEKIDMVLSLNGVPVATIELKHPLSKTGWRAEDAIHQYQYERNANGRLFAFNTRTLVHFAVDTQVAYMTTRLDGENTRFLPFNKGDNNGVGNPVADDNYRTHYLWEDVLQKDCFMDIIARFLHLQKNEQKIRTPNGWTTQESQTMIFPRFHQLDAVRRLVAHSKTHKSGHNYLIQHSAGSGKSNTIAWLAHQLSSLHDEHNHKIFDSVIVITDRVVLDRQLQNTVSQFEQTAGVVQKIDKDTKQLVKALAGGVKIIITTIHKFPYIMHNLSKQQEKGVAIEINTKNKNFAIIVDEAHSSQSGEMASELRRILNKDGIESAILAEYLDDDQMTDDAQKALFIEHAKRQKQSNLSYFAFTATPKWKTLALFDEPSDTGKAPFHLYSMKQAIEEGFILDVLANYSTYKQYFELVKIADIDPELSKNKTKHALKRFALLHPSSIAQKVEIIVEHFYHTTRHKIGGKAKAMVVTASRESAVRYKLAFDEYVKEKGYDNIKSLVAFSGVVKLDENIDKEYTEVMMNGGILETQLPQKFASDDYQVLLVADKYQTGFDEPLLHTMFVDKKLSGVQAVQTLSRLNRKTIGKIDTFVMDFVNEEKDIYKAFKPFYEVSELGEIPKVDKLNSLGHTLDNYKIYDFNEIKSFIDVWFSPTVQINQHQNKKLNHILDKAIQRYKDIDAPDDLSKQNKQSLFKSQIASYIKLYQFVSQIINYGDNEHEMRYIYLQSLLQVLPKGTLETKVDLSKFVALKYYRLEQLSQGSIQLKNGENKPLKGATDVGTGGIKITEELFKLVNALNEEFATEFTVEDQLFFDSIEQFANENVDIQQAVKNNSLPSFMEYFKETLFDDIITKLFDSYENSVKKIYEDDKIRTKVAKRLGEQIYQNIKK